MESPTPIVKRKRRASCLDEQERKERKRAIDREAQRSLREKTKAHIAELEHTIEILRSKDQNGATASLLAEIEGLRAENERLRDVIEGVRSVIGGEVAGRMSSSAGPVGGGVAESAAADEFARQSSPQPRRRTSSRPKATSPTKPPVLSPPTESTPHRPHCISERPGFASPPTQMGRTVDLDGMTLIPPPPHPIPFGDDSASNTTPSFEHVRKIRTQNLGSPSTAAFAPFDHEFSDANGRRASSTVLHIDGPATSPGVAVSHIYARWQDKNRALDKMWRNQS